VIDRLWVGLDPHRVKPDPPWVKLVPLLVRISAGGVETDATLQWTAVETDQDTGTDTRDTGKKTKSGRTPAAEKTSPTDGGTTEGPTVLKTDGLTREIEKIELNATNVAMTLMKSADGATIALTLIVVETTCLIRKERTRRPAAAVTGTGRQMSAAAPLARVAGAVLNEGKVRNAGVRADSTAGGIGKKMNGGSGMTRETSGTRTTGGRPGTEEIVLVAAVAVGASVVVAAVTDAWITTEMARTTGKRGNPGNWSGRRN